MDRVIAHGFHRTFLQRPGSIEINKIYPKWIIACARMQKMRGFTLLELVIVLVLVGIMAAIAIPMWPGTSINLSAEADHIAADLVYTQSLAITSGQRYYWVKTSTTSYQIRNGSDVAIIYPGTGSTTITLNSGITFGALTNLPNALVAFDGKGKPYTTSASPGTPLAATATINLITTDGNKAINIYPNTGYIQVQ